MRAVGYGVAAYALSVLLTPFGYFVADLTHPLPLTLGGI